MRKSKIVVFGGAFNPPTSAHGAIIKSLLDLPQFNEVWAMVSGDRLDKYMAVGDAHRIRMLELAVKDGFSYNPRFKTSDFELNLPRPTQTYQTLMALEQAYPETEFWFAFGADSYNSILSWPNGAKLRNRLQRIVLFERHGAYAVADVEQIIRLTVPSNFKNVSSSELRRLVASGKSLDGLVTKPVAEYIAKQKLYV